LLEGRIIIVTDGTPFVLIAPTLMWQFIQATDDYYERFFGSFLRIIRALAFLFALFLPSIYIALTTFHQEMIPFTLLVSINVAREGVPFPAFVEAFTMEFMFELLREAGIRLPMQIGQAVSIVGAIILGQAAIQANLVSPAMVIIVAITGISSFLIPAFNYAIALRLMRFGVMILAASLGLFGILVVAMVLLTHLVSLRSFGVPYMSPLAPLNLRELKDVLLRMPKWTADQRPSILRPLDKIRQDSNLKPQPDSD
jgi:spore germination protein KA